jgi:hypothetical protein
MSNIHGLGTTADRNANNRGGQGAFQGNSGEVPNFLNKFVTSQSERPAPRKETFLQMLKFTFCPNITWQYFTAIITIVQIITFIICDVATAIQGLPLSSGNFLGPSR